MNDVKNKIKEYLSKTRLMQLATCVDNKPWSCTLHFTYDDELNLYWISKPDTRHSQEIKKNPYVAGVIFSDKLSPQKGVKGLSFEGTAELLSGDEEEKASKLYIKQFNREESLLENIRSEKNPHKLYVVKTSKFVLFDSENKTNVRQEYMV